MPKIVHLSARVDAPIEAVFACLNDHHQFGRIWPGTSRRIKDSAEPGNVNGVGSERQIKIGPIPGLMIFREAITVCEPPHLLEYQAVGPAPVKNHLGRIQLRQEGDSTVIDYSIQLDTVIPGLTGLVLKDLKKQWANGFPVLKTELEDAAAR